MKFVDEAEIEVQSGNGGDGCVSFCRARCRPKGGPDGGDGGRGGSVIVRAYSGLSTLLDHRYYRHYRAKNGQQGMGSDRYGACANDLLVKVPVGTQIYDPSTNELVGDLDAPEKELVVAKGGNGGRGNLHFKSSTHQAPRKAEAGQLGVKRKLRLELKLLADVGIVGFPNTGKSSLVSCLSRSRPKIADYPFTTLVPNLGVVQLGEHDSFVMADVPGLVEGAHQGVGLGHRFLKHVERCRVLVHLTTWLPGEEPDPQLLLQRFDTLEREMELFDPHLSRKPRLVGISKLDLAEVRQLVAPLTELLAKRNIPVVPISSATRQGLEQFIKVLVSLMRKD